MQSQPGPFSTTSVSNFKRWSNVGHSLERGAPALLAVRQESPTEQEFAFCSVLFAGETACDSALEQGGEGEKGKLSLCLGTHHPPAPRISSSAAETARVALNHPGATARAAAGSAGAGRRGDRRPRTLPSEPAGRGAGAGRRRGSGERAARTGLQPRPPGLTRGGHLRLAPLPRHQAEQPLSPPRAPHAARPPTRTPCPRKATTRWNRSPLFRFPVAAAGKSTINKIERKESIRRIKIQSPLPSALGWQTGPVFSDPRIQPLLHELFRPVGILCIFFMNTCFK